MTPNPSGQAAFLKALHHIVTSTLGHGSGRWQTYMKRDLLRLISQGFRVGLSPPVLQLVQNYESREGGLTGTYEEFLAEDIRTWGQTEQVWNWITLPDGSTFTGSPSACMYAFRTAALAKATRMPPLPDSSTQLCVAAFGFRVK